VFSPEKIRLIVEKAFPDSRTEAKDMTGTNDHFELVVVTSAFEGKGMVERHRMVYSAIGPAVGAEIHALKLKTLTPTEAARK
jgi:stress-induced morphogen